MIKKNIAGVVILLKSSKIKKIGIDIEGAGKLILIAKPYDSH